MKIIRLTPKAFRAKLRRASKAKALKRTIRRIVAEELERIRRENDAWFSGLK